MGMAFGRLAHRTLNRHLCEGYVRRHGLRLAVLGAIFATILLAATATTVYLAPKGKTYHSRRDCMALARSTEVFTATESAALAHGLKPCKICNRPKATAKPEPNAWAKGGK